MGEAFIATALDYNLTWCMEYFLEYDILPQGQNCLQFVLLVDRYLDILFCEVQK